MSRAHTEKESAELSAFKILVTRDVRQASDLSNRLAALGADVFEYPVIEIIEPASTVDLDRSLSNLHSYDWIVFASTNAVDFFLNRMKALNISPEEITATAIAAVGEKTADRVKAHGLGVAFCPQEFSASAFAREFCATQKVDGKKILWPRTNVGKLTIKELLEQHGASVNIVTAYETHLPQQALDNIDKLTTWIGQVAALKSDHEQDKSPQQLGIITVTSSQAVKNLGSLLSEYSRQNGGRQQALMANCKIRLPGIIIVSIGSETHSTAENIFECEFIQSEEFTIPGIVESIKKLAAAQIRGSLSAQQDGH